MNAKTRPKPDYPSAAWRRSYARRSGAERGFATAKDPAGNDIARGWCRLMGLAPLMLFTATLLVVRNQRILTAWNTRQEENQQRAAGACPRRPANAAARPSLPLPHRRNPPRPRARVPHRHHQDKDGGSMPAASQEHTQSNQPDTQRS